MTDRAQFEAMLEALINEDQEKAKEIFHNIVVAKSREIYEELLSEDFDLAEEGEGEAAPEEEAVEEMFGDEEGDEEGDMGDEEGDMGDEEGDMGDEEGDMGDEEGADMSDEEQTDRILDLEDALEDLKAEFEALMAGEEGGEEGGDLDAMMQGGMGEEGEMVAPAPVMEYVNKVPAPKHGDNGTNTKSLIDNMKNDMGGSNKNIAQSHEEKGAGTKGGLLNPATKEDNAGNINVPGGNAGKTAFKKKEPGHGAEKKGAGETAQNKKSLIGSKG